MVPPNILRTWQRAIFVLSFGASIHGYCQPSPEMLDQLALQDISQEGVLYQYISSFGVEDLPEVADSIEVSSYTYGILDKIAEFDPPISFELLFAYATPKSTNGAFREQTERALELLHNFYDIRSLELSRSVINSDFSTREQKLRAAQLMAQFDVQPEKSIAENTILEIYRNRDEYSNWRAEDRILRTTIFQAITSLETEAALAEMIDAAEIMDSLDQDIGILVIDYLAKFDRADVAAMLEQAFLYENMEPYLRIKSLEALLYQSSISNETISGYLELIRSNLRRTTTTDHYGDVLNAISQEIEYREGLPFNAGNRLSNVIDRNDSDQVNEPEETETLFVNTRIGWLISAAFIALIMGVIGFLRYKNRMFRKRKID